MKNKSSYIVMVILILIGIITPYLYNDYKENKSNKILQNNETVKTGNATLAIIQVDKEGNETKVDEFPSKTEYAFDYLLSSCTNGSKIKFDETAWTASVTASKKDNCKFYFRPRLGELAEDIIAKANKNDYLYKSTPDFSKIAENESGVFASTDDLGTSYYFRGFPDNNYIVFGSYAEDTTLTVYDYNEWTEKTVEVKAGSPMYWRIVRINGDGSIRLIYDGTEKVANGENHIASIASSVFNNNINDSKYNGFTYNENGEEIDSVIKTVLDEWYNDHLIENYDQYIADAIFCNDRKIEKKYYLDENGVESENEAGSIGYGVSYSARYRNDNPTLICSQKSDRYTIDGNLGNGLLKNPIGLITFDELKMAGAGSINSNLQFMNTGEYFWTLTPLFYDFLDGTRNIYGSYSYYGIDSVNVNIDGMPPSVRPVINLKADVKFTGDGSYETPYTIVTN